MLIGGWLIESNLRTVAFAGFAPEHARPRLWEIVASGKIWTTALLILRRLGLGLA